MLEKQEVNQLLLIHGRLAQLPPNYSNWLDLDSQSRLPKDVYFAQRKKNWRIMIAGLIEGTILIGILFFGATYVIEDMLRGVNWIAIVFAIGSGALFLVYALKGLLMFWYQVTALYTQKRGRLRQGVFLGSDSLLICLPDNHYHLIPLTMLKSVDIETGWRPNDYGTSGRIRFTLTDDVNEEVEKKFGGVEFPSQYLDVSDSDIIDRIKNHISK